MYSTLIASLVLGLFQAQSTLASCAHGTHLYRREEAAGGVKIPDFNYRTTKGPTNWHSISPENKMCAIGKTQSPIVLDSTIPLEGSGFVKMEIESQHDIPFENLGTTVEVVLGGKTVVGNSTFSLKQFHFHTPSEHRIDDEYFPIEVHFVHEAEGDPSKIAVVALLIQLTDCESLSTRALHDVISHVDAIKTPGSTTKIPTIDFNCLLNTISSSQFYRYEGSLTTPPCSEGVSFLVTAEPLPLHVRQFNALKAVVKANSRFAQNTLGQENLLQVAAANLPGNK